MQEYLYPSNPYPMKSITLELPDKTYDHLKAIALFEEKPVQAFAKEILILAERELWKTHGRQTEELLKGLDYFNKHCR